MTGTWAYNSTTNILTVTGATSGAPARCVDAWNFDKASVRTLKAATASPFTASLDTAVMPAESIALKLSAIITNFSAAGTVTLTGKDAWGNTISEVLTVNANGTVISTLYYASINANGIVAEGTFTVAITQPRLGVVWKNNANQYAFGCVLQDGDGSTSSYFSSILEQLTFLYAPQNAIITVKNAATLTFGALINASQKSTAHGVDMMVLRGDGANPTLINAESGSLVYLYHSTFKVLRYDTLTLGANQGYLSGYITRLWNCSIDYGVISTLYTAATPDIYNLIATYGRSESLFRITNQAVTIDKLVIFNAPQILRTDLSGNPVISNVIARNCTYVLSFSNTQAGNGYFINCDIDNWAFSWSSGSNGNVYRQYTIDLITDPSATVTMKDKNGNTVFSVIADSVTGAIVTQTVSRGYYNKLFGDVMQDYGPFALTITKAGKMPYVATGFILDRKTDLKIALRDQLSGTAAASDVANGKTFYKDDADSQLTGMHVNPAIFVDVASGKTILNLNKKKLENQLVLNL